MTVEALRIDDDDLSFELLREVERSFAVDLADHELAKVTTAGDLHSLVIVAATYSGGAGCSTAIAFYALRRSLSAYGVPLNARPSFVLADICRTSPKRLKRAIERATGLVLPALTLGLPAAVGCALALPLAGLGAWLLGWGAVPVALALCVGMIRFDRGRFGAEWATLGSVTKATAALNHAALAGRGARHSDRTAWAALCGILSGWGTPADRIGPDTRLLG